jgi:hypothetical protein
MNGDATRLGSLEIKVRESKYNFTLEIGRRREGWGGHADSGKGRSIEGGIGSREEREEEEKTPTRNTGTQRQDDCQSLVNRIGAAQARE